MWLSLSMCVSCFGVCGCRCFDVAAFVWWCEAVFSQECCVCVLVIRFRFVFQISFEFVCSLSVNYFVITRQSFQNFGVLPVCLPDVP